MLNICNCNNPAWGTFQSSAETLRHFSLYEARHLQVDCSYIKLNHTYVDLPQLLLFDATTQQPRSTAEATKDNIKNTKEFEAPLDSLVIHTNSLSFSLGVKEMLFFLLEP